MKKDFFPGWKMTMAQHNTLIRLWTGACAAQGWDKLGAREREAQRKLVLTRVFGYARSFTEIDSTKGCDAIFREFKRLANAVTDDNGERNRLLHAVGKLLTDINELVEPGYIATLLKDRFKAVEGVRPVTDLSNKTLSQLVYTLKARIKTLQSATVPF